MKRNISVTTDFISGGGDVRVIESSPVQILFSPHDEGLSGWSKVWWYFMVDGIFPGEALTLKLDMGFPTSSGITPQVFFSYDQKIWGLTDIGSAVKKNGQDYFLYSHKVKNTKVWFAYDLPYTSEHINDHLVPSIENDKNAEVYTFCTSRKGRKNRALRLLPKDNSSPTYGIWLQARAHAFESGSSWVLHGLAEWLLSDAEDAILLRNCSEITIIPIVDIDGVSEGRTGKYQNPYDHWMKWYKNEHFWPEVNAIKDGISKLASQNMADMFIDFHGPGAQSHPYFILPFSDQLPYSLQQINRSAFFKVLNAKKLDSQATATQSMRQIHYSERHWDTEVLDSSHEWVTKKGNEHTLAFTLEVNMNTPLSNREGYRSEALVLGEAISKYFIRGHHKKKG